MGAVIRTESLTKYYGKQRGIEDLTLEVDAGQVFGYLGPNGAGKTTTIRTLLDFIRATSGRATVLGLDIGRETLEIRRRTGYLPGEVALYPKLEGRELLRYFASLRDGVDWSYVDELAERLDCDLTRPIRTLSHGNQQKVAVIQALMHRPDLLVFDEPTQGLDPLIQQEFNRLMRETTAEGRSVFLSSHMLSEVEQLCDRVGIIRNGHLVEVAHIADLKARALRRVEIQFAEAVPPDAFRGLLGVEDVEVRDSLVRCTVTGEPDAIVKAAARFHVTDLKSDEPSLEEIFLAFYGKGNEEDEVLAVPQEATDVP